METLKKYLNTPEKRIVAIIVAIVLVLLIRAKLSGKSILPTVPAPTPVTPDLSGMDTSGSDGTITLNPGPTGGPTGMPIPVPTPGPLPPQPTPQPGQTPAYVTTNGKQSLSQIQYIKNCWGDVTILKNNLTKYPQLSHYTVFETLPAGMTLQVCG